MNNCIICETTFKVKPNTSGKYCSLSCGNKGRYNPNSRANNEAKYNLSPVKCLNCDNSLTYQQKRQKNKFCSSSCAASISNLGKVHPPETRLKISKSSERPEYTRITYCVECRSIFKIKHSNIPKTCSKECKSILLSRGLRGKTGGSTKQYIKVLDSFGIEVSLDSSWELNMANDLNTNEIKWVRPRSFILSNGRKYTPDFYLPDYGIYLDPKAFRKGYLTQVEKIKQFEEEYQVRCLVISNKENLTWCFIRQELAF